MGSDDDAACVNGRKGKEVGVNEEMHDDRFTF
jgi:hypothetical protein